MDHLLLHCDVANILWGIGVWESLSVAKINSKTVIWMEDLV